jgi:hypothetical protein
MLQYVDIDHARAANGVRIVVSPLVPSPWSEAAKAVFRIANIPVLAVRKTRDLSTEVAAWTGVDNVPAVLHGVEPVRTNWAAIVALAARLGEPGAILPTEIVERADVMGTLDLIAGEDGLGWNGRLAMIDASVTSNGERGFPKGLGEYLAKRYGHTHAMMPAVRERVATQLAILRERLAAQSCPQLSPGLRAAFGVAAEAFGDLLPDELVAHRTLLRASPRAADHALTGVLTRVEISSRSKRECAQHSRC